MIEARLGPGPEARFLRAVTGELFTIIDVSQRDYERTIELITTYRDLGLGFVDASIIAIAERCSIETIATLNRRDFAVVRPSHIDAFQLVP